MRFLALSSNDPERYPADGPDRMGWFLSQVLTRSLTVRGFIVDEFQRSVPGTTAKDVMNLVLMTQYFDTLGDVARNGRSNVLFLPSNPGSVGDLFQEIRNSLLSAHEADRAAYAADPNFDPDSEA